MKSIKEWQKHMFKQRKNNGFEDHKLQDGTFLMLITSELGEALESIRKDEPHVFGVYEYNTFHNTTGLANPLVKNSAIITDIDMIKEKKLKPEGLGPELADVILYLLAYCELKGIDLEKMMELKDSYNKTRPKKHNKKF